MTAENYVIRGGKEGRERLRLLSDVMGKSTRALLDEAGVNEGSVCLDLGCGGGDVAFELAKRVGPGGRVVGLDLDGTKVALARSEALEQGIANVEFHDCDLTTWEAGEMFDVAYARFLLSHLPEPAGLLRSLRRCLKPGGLIIIEDVDFRGHFAEPLSPALDRYVELYSESVKRRGGNADIGPLLPALLRDAGFDGVSERVAHPTAHVGGIKVLSCVTLESISAAVLEDRLVGEEELQAIIDGLRAFAADSHTLIGGPRVHQAWGRLAH